MIKCFELPVIDNTRKSFYGKAIVYELSNGTKVLKSYNTCVAYIDKNRIHRTWGSYSYTTMRHINNFNLFYNLPTFGKSIWERMNIETVPLLE